MKSLGLLLVISLLVFSSVVAALLIYFPRFLSVTSEIQYDADDPSYNKGYWRQEIKSKGSERAYAAFVEKNSLQPEQRQHFFAHAMGEALFEELGIEGVVSCTDAFSFGCYHGFSTRAIASGGVEALMKLDAVCVKTFGHLSGCKHGLGHGILEYVGYQKLERALAMCTSLVAQPTPLMGCTSGVFMEYLSPLVDSDSKSRMIEYSNPYSPCTDIPKQYRSSCYFELGQWFRQTPNTDYGALCNALEEGDAHYCFLGIGTDMTRGWKDAETLIARCARFGALGELACRAGAAWSLVGNTTAVELCAYEDQEQRRTCIQTADLTQGIDPSIQESLK